MMRLKHILTLTVAALFLGAPGVFAQNPDPDQTRTLTNLLEELKASHAAALGSDSLSVASRQWREELAGMVKATDELTLKLYSQNPEFSFDMAFALEDISKMYQSFHEKVSLSDNLMNASKAGLRQYSLLGETLRGMIPAPSVDTLALDDSLVAILPPPEPIIRIDSVQAALIDSCLYYTDALTGMYEESVAMAIQDSLLYANTDLRLQQAFEYAQTNYENSQKSMFIVDNASIVYIIKNWKSFIQNVKEDMYNRYASLASGSADGHASSLPGARTWDGTYILAYALLMLILLLLAFIAAALLNLLFFKFVKDERVRALRPILSPILAIVLYVVLMLLIKPAINNQYWKMSYELLSQFS